MKPKTADISLEKLIDFDRDKHSLNFGRPFLRTKDYELQQYNRSFYRNPVDLYTDEHDWNTRPLENSVTKTSTDNILTLPQLYCSVDGPFNNNVPTHHVSFFRREPESFDNHRRRLHKYSDALKKTNDYLTAERIRFRLANNDNEDPHYNRSGGDTASNKDNPHQIDKLGYVTKLPSCDLVDSNSPHKHNAQHELKHPNKQNEHGKQNKQHEHRTPPKPQKQRAFFVDTYKQESVDHLLHNSEALLQTNPDGATAFDCGSAEEYCNVNEEETDEYDYEVEFGEPADLTNELVVYCGQNARSPKRSGEYHHQKNSTISPNKGHKFKTLAYSPPAASAPENILRLNNETSFALSADTEITLGHIDRCIYRNSRRFGTKFDAKVDRKKEVLSREKKVVRDRAARKLGNSHSHSHNSSTEGELRATVSETVPPGPALLATSSHRSQHPLMPLPSTHTMNLAPVTAKSKPPAALSVSRPTVRANSLSGFGDKKVGHQWFQASPVASLHNKFYFPVSDSDALSGDHGDEASGIHLVTFDEMMKASVVSESHAQGLVGSYALTPQLRTANDKLTANIVFDISAKGNIADVLLQSELPVERPKSADKALVKGIRDDQRQSSQAATKSFRSLLALRRNQIKKPDKGRARKNLLTLVYISEEVADIERRALIALFESCGGHNWVNSSNWCSDRPVRYWHGVGVTVEGYVFEIDLSANNLTGEFPDSIHLFRQLEMIVVDENHLVGSLPDYSLSKCLNLVVLSAQHNRMSGIIPFNLLAGLDRLTDVWLSHNEFSGPLQEGIGELRSLVNLCLFRNQLSGPLPASLCKLGNLEVLSLGNNAFSGRIPPLVSLHKLRTLSLYNNDFSGPVPEWLETIPYLEELELFGNPGLTGFVPNGVKDLTIRCTEWFNK